MADMTINTSYIKPSSYGGNIFYRRANIVLRRAVNKSSAVYFIAKTDYADIYAKDDNKNNIILNVKNPIIKSLFQHSKFSKFTSDFDSDNDTIEDMDFVYDYYNDLNEMIYKLEFTAFVVPKPACIVELDVKKKIIIIYPRVIRYSKIYNSNFNINQVIIVNNDNKSVIATRIRVLLQLGSRSTERLASISLGDFNNFCRLNGLNYSNNLDIMFKIPIIRNRQLLIGYRPSDTNGIFDKITDANSIYSNNIMIDNTTYSFAFNFEPLVDVDLPFAVEQDKIAGLVEISNIIFRNRLTGAILFRSDRSYVTNEQTVEQLLINTQMPDDFFTQSIDNYDINMCEVNTIQNIYLYFVQNPATNGMDTNVKNFVESYLRKNFCIEKLFETYFVQIYRFHNIIKHLMILFISSKYFKIMLNTNNIRHIFKQIPKYVNEHVDNNHIAFKGFVSVSNSLEYGADFIMNKFADGSKIDIIFDSGNDSNTYITTRLLKKLNYLRPDDMPQDQLIANNTILNNFFVSSLGVNDANPVLTRSKLCKLYFKFNSPRLDNNLEYTINAFIKDSTAYDILFGQDTMKQLFDDGYSIKYKVPRGSFIVPNDYVTSIRTIITNPININSIQALSNVYYLLNSIKINFIDISLLTNQTINEIIRNSRAYFNTMSKFQKQLLFILLKINDNETLNKLYNTFQIEPADRLTYEQIMA
jgi:hypothetical protein